VDVFDRSIVKSLNQPFFGDFVLSNRIFDSYDIAHFNGNPFGKTLTALKYFNPDIKIVSAVPAHNLEVSIEEHERYGINYAQHYPHMVDPEQWEKYTHHIVNSDLVIYPSKISRDYLVEKLQLKNESKVIPHGCVPPKTIPSLPERFSVGYIGATGPDKGLRYLTEAWSQLDFTEEKLTFYGAASSGASYWIQNYSRGGNFVLHGYYTDLDEIMGGISVGLFPSVTEGFGICILECLAYGRPVITTEGAGASELIKNGKEGFIVPIRDSDAISEKIKWFKDNPDEIKAMGDEGRKTAEQYTWSRAEDAYFDAYWELVVK